VRAKRPLTRLKAAFIINRNIANAAIGRQAVVTLAQFEDLPVLGTALNQRVIYAESAAQGLAVIEAAPHSEAVREMGNLVQQILVSNTDFQHRLPTQTSNDLTHADVTRPGSQPAALVGNPDPTARAAARN
jgi:hypothetical protein